MSMRCGKQAIWQPGTVQWGEVGYGPYFCDEHKPKRQSTGWKAWAGRNVCAWRLAPYQEETCDYQEGVVEEWPESYPEHGVSSPHELANRIMMEWDLT